MRDTPQSLSEIRSLISSGKLSVTELTESYLENIESQKDLNAFISVFGEEAILKAGIVDEKIRNHTEGSLAGLVVSVKDNISIKGKPLTCASRMLSNFTALYNATAVQRLIDSDAIIIGKTNCDEFAMGSSNENSFFGPVLNPCDKTKVSGGSSGGSAVSVAANMCLVSLGSETGGSVRQPASFCGITGLKATYGRISRSGLTAFASSFDSIGIFGRNNHDIAETLEVIAGLDEMDSTSSQITSDKYTESLKQNFSAGDIKIGYIKEYFGTGLDNEIRKELLRKIEELSNKGFDVKEISMPHSDYVLQTYTILTSAEASSNLARYDGVRFGYRAEGFGNSIEEMYIRTRSEGFGTEVKRRIMLGTYILSEGYFDEYYKKGQKARRVIIEDFNRAFEKADYLITPTTPTTAFGLGEKTTEPLKMYLSDIYTVSANLAGLPAISIPSGIDSRGLPFGAQLIGKKFDESGLLKMCDVWNNVK